MKRLTAALLVVGLAAMGLASRASANTIYSLTVPNTDLTSYPAPYGSATVDLLDSTHATITFLGGSAGAFTYKFGGAGSVDVNVNGTFSVGSLSGFTSPTIGSGNISSFGDFNLTIKNFDGSSDAMHSASFELTAIGSTSWASSADVLTPDNLGFLAAGHIFVYNVDGANVKTGYAGNGTVPSVPDGGATVALLGAGLLGLAAFRRRLVRR